MLMKIYKKLLSEFGEQKWWPTISKNRRFEIIVGAILTQNTAWKNVEKAIRNLDKKNMLSKESIKNIPEKDLALLIKPAGYYNQKAKKLKLVANFKDRITRENLLGIWGIGKETADSILLYAYDRPYFVIDAYTKRIMKRIGFKEDSYEELQNLFQNNLPKDVKIYKEFHALLVELGKRYCMKKPKCDKCPVKDVCRFYGALQKPESSALK